MVSCLRSAKSGSSWTKNELSAFNIKVVSVDANVFFGFTELSPAPGPDSILNNLGMPDEDP